MTRAVTLGTKVRRGWVAAPLALMLGGLLLMACAGGGKDRDFTLSAGKELDSVRSDRVLLVVESQNECGSDNACVTIPPGGPCHLGDGNTHGLAVYRLGTTGLLFGNASTGAVAEQRIATDDNPRRLAVHPNDPTLVFVATRRRVQAIRLRAGGGSACFSETAADDEVKEDADDSDPVDLAIDPTIGNGILYVAERGADRVDAYTIGADGSLSKLPSSCIVGSGDTEYAALAPMGDNFFAAAGLSRIDVHSRVQGQFLPEPDPNATVTPTPAATASPSPAPGQTPGPTDPSPAPSTCINARLVSSPLSSIGAALVNDLIFQPSASAPIGQLFIAEEASERMFTFPVDASGILSDSDDSSTKRAGVYQRMLRHRHSGAEILYATVFNEGRVDVFKLDSEGLLPDESFSRTAEDPNSSPVGMVIDEPTGTILYVAEGGLHRVDGFRIQPDGGLPDKPATSTAPAVDASGNEFDTFPDDVAIVLLP